MRERVTMREGGSVLKWETGVGGGRGEAQG